MGQVGAADAVRWRVGGQRDTPTQEEVEDALDRYAGLAQNPVIVH